MPARERPPKLPTSTLREVCGAGAPATATSCSSSTRLEALLRHPSLQVLDSYITSHGTTKPQRLRVRVVPEGEAAIIFYAKWKQAPPSGDRTNNSPRRELAAFELQQMLFEGPDELVPPTVLRCLELDALPASMEASAFPGTRCALGVMAFWVTEAEELGDFDEERFERDLTYRRRFSNLNVFTYLVEHRDSAGLNFLSVGSGLDLRVFAVDNGLSFGALRYNPIGLFTSRRVKLRVPSMSVTTAARLRELDRSSLARLAVVERFALQGGMLVPATTDGAAWSATSGIRKRPDGVEFGLTRAELDVLDERRRSLVKRLDDGKVTTF